VTVYYFYIADAHFGLGFIKICAYFPYPPRYGSTVTNGPSVKPPLKAWPSLNSPTASPRVRRPSNSSASATGWDQPTCSASSTVG
jgi:hypothetical protein